MARHYYSQFDNRQEMNTSDFEIFYYEDKSFSEVDMHRHDYYEIYFFLEGDLSYQINQNMYILHSGDFCLIPPGVFHRPKFHSHKTPYRRIVLWLSPEYYERLVTSEPDAGYGFFYSQGGNYHFSCDFSKSQVIFDKLLRILEEQTGNTCFRNSMLTCNMISLLLSINRIVYETKHPMSPLPEEASLFSRLCEYINLHLEDDLSLDALAGEFFVSKYHISHIFKKNMGISLHQYLSKKRVYACKNLLLAGHPVMEIAKAYGFSDYSAFFRAFKKEFGVGPKEYRESFSPTALSHPESSDAIESTRPKDV